MTLSSLLLTGKGESSPPSTFVLPRVQSPRLPKFPNGLVWTLQADVYHIWDFDSLTNISIPPVSGHWSGLVTMIQVNSLSVLAVVRSGGADTTFHIYKTLAPGQHPARCSIYTEIIICEMADPWPNMMKTFFFFSCWLFRSVFLKVKSIISPVKSSTDNRLLRGVIREGCPAVAWVTVISPRPLTGLRIRWYQVSITSNLL